jgi:polysaccharide deacetylase 2 family uncharacterized protein YibQ
MKISLSSRRKPGSPAARREIPAFAGMTLIAGSLLLTSCDQLNSAGNYVTSFFHSDDPKPDQNFVQPVLPTPAISPGPLVENPFDLGEEDSSLAPITTQSIPTPPPLPAPIPYKQKPMISIVIDDMGVDLKRSAQALDLPSNVTMSYLPYARNIATQVEAAKSKGHEVILHMPMQAMNPKENPGPHYLRTDMSAAELEENITASLNAFSGYDGVNNHEGSKFTADRPGLDIFMTDLEKRHVFFLDSRTSAQSVAEEVAREHHLPTTHRNVFIDHIETPAFVAAALKHTEDIARRTGSAIAIGHPKDVTLPALKTWLATLEAKGFQVVSLATVVEYRNK